MVSEAKKRAIKKYQKEHIKQLKVEFFPAEHDLLEKIKIKGKAYGGLYKYVKDVLRKDIESEDLNEKIDGEQ